MTWLPLVWLCLLLPKILNAWIVQRAAVGFRKGSVASSLFTLHAKKNREAVKNKNRLSGGTGFSSKPLAPPTYNVKASVQHLEKKYDDLLRQNEKSIQSQSDDQDDHLLANEYMVAVRSPTVPDWVPIAHLLLCRPLGDSRKDTADEEDSITSPRGTTIPGLLHLYRRELGYLAAQGSRSLSNTPRNLLEYSVEPLSSFHQHVYNTVVEPNHDDNNTTMTRQEARVVLDLTDTDDASKAKRQYRSRSFALHPDRFQGNATEKEAALKEFAQVKLAYETLVGGGSDGSWYASLGGKARSEFVGPVTMKEGEEAMGGIQSALTRVNHEIVQDFVARYRNTMNRSS